MTRTEKFERTKHALVALGYRYEISRDGTERLFRPDGTLAVIRQPGSENGESPQAHRV